MERASRGLGHWEEALRRGNEAVEIYRQLGDVEMTTSAIYKGASVLLLTGRCQEAVEMARSGLAELGDEPTERRADFLAVLGSSYAILGSYVPAKEAFNEATAAARELSNPRLLAGVLANWSVLNGIFLEVADDLSNSRKSLESSQSESVPWVRAIALNEQMMALHRAGRVEDASRVCKELEPIARKIGHVGFLATCIWTHAWAEFGKVPDLMKLEAQLGEGVEMCRTARVPMNTAQSLAQLSLAKFFRGQQSSALDCALEASRLEVPGYLEGFLVGTIFRERAYCGDHAGAMALLSDTSVKLKLPRENQPNTFGSWAFLISVVEGLTMLGERERAAEFYPLVCGLLDTGMISFPMMARFPRTIAGVAATAARQWQAAEEHFRIALRQAEEIPDQLERAECRRFYGSMLLNRNSAGDPQEARRLLTHALEDYSRIGMPLHIELTQALLD
jgi:tetratricopeptide (TPR) repeat protein